ncbi:DedA family protein [Candidatus Micrarchaeota archaeon]|nr:DedA family protein [Candidatus Micrarchaeota archaeon]
MIDLVALGIQLVQNYGLIGLFLIAFFSASLLPFPSEPVILIASKLWGFWEILVIVTFASTIAAVINYYVGLKGIRFFLTPRDKKRETQARELIQKYGIPALIASPWIPFIGDLFPVAAGFMKMDFKHFMIAIVIARVLKTVVILYAGFALFG